MMDNGFTSLCLLSRCIFGGLIESIVPVIVESCTSYFGCQYFIVVIYLRIIQSTIIHVQI